MGIWAWLALLLGVAAIATVGQYLFFARNRKSGDDDWAYMAAGALIGGFTGHAWYPGTGPTFDGLNVLPAIAGGLIGAVVLELVYRFVLRPRQPSA